MGGSSVFRFLLLGVFLSAVLTENHLTEAKRSRFYRVKRRPARAPVIAKNTSSTPEEKAAAAKALADAITESSQESQRQRDANFERIMQRPQSLMSGEEGAAALAALVASRSGASSVSFQRTQGFSGLDEFEPAGWQLQVGEKSKPHEPSSQDDRPALWPAGVGMALMNGCFGKNYAPEYLFYGARWRRFWWYDSKASGNKWPKKEKDVLGHPYGSCMNNAAHCFGRLPEYLRQDSTSLLAIDGKGTAYKWKFVASNPTSNAAWRAFHDHVETPLGAIRDNKIWNPQVMAGNRFNYDQDSFWYQDKSGVKSVTLAGENSQCFSTLEIGPTGVDNLYDPGCNYQSPSNSLSLYFSEE